MAGFEGADSGGNVVVARSFFRDNRVGVLLVSAGKEAAPATSRTRPWSAT